MDSGFKINGISDLKKALAGVVNRFPEEKDKELLRLCYMCLREVILETPVDTGRLRASLSFNAGALQSQEFEGKVEGGIDKGQDQVEFGTNVDYAPAIEDGFTVNQRFVPGEWSGSRFKYIPGAKTGMTLHPQFVLGKHMFAKGFQNFEPKAKADLENWVKKMLQQIEKNNNDIIATFQDL